MKLNYETVVAGLERRGVPNHVAQGVAMNFQDESGFDTGIPGDNGHAYGLAQWNGPRKRALQSFAAQRGASVDDGDMQLDFFMHENATNEAGAWNRVMASGSKEEAAVAFVNHWERPAEEHRASRTAKYAGGRFIPNRGAVSNASYAGTGIPAGQPDMGIAATEMRLPNEKQVQLPDPAQAGLWQLTKDAAATEQTAAWLFAPRTQTARDDKWRLTTDRMEADFKSQGLPIDETYMGIVDGSHSEANYQEKLGMAKVNFDRVNRLQQAGMVGMGLQMANQILDPIALGADIVASSVAPELVLANRGRRIHRVLAGAIGGGAGALAGEAVKASVNPNYQQADLFYGTVMGLGVGAAVGSLMRGTATMAEAGMLQKAAQNSVTNYEDNILNTIPGRPGSVGAAGVGDDTFLKDGAFEFLDIKEMNESAFTKGRFSLAAYLNSSKNVVTRGLAGLVQDGVGKKGGAINHIAASEDKDRLVQEFGVRLGRVAQPQLKAFIKEKGYSFTQRGRAEYDFGAEVNKLMFDRRKDKFTHYPDSVVHTAKKLKELYHEALGLQKNPFVRDGMVGRPVAGALDVTDDADWSGPRFWDEQRVVIANGHYADGELNRLFEGSLRAAQPDLDEAFLKRLANGFSTAIVKRAHGLEAMARGSVGVEDMEELAQTLMTHGGLSSEDAHALLRSFKPDGSDAGRDSSLKRRMLLKEDFRLEGANSPILRDGTRDEKGLGIMDLLSQDAIGNFNRYIRPTMGRVALSRYRFKDPVKGDVIINGITSDGEFRQLIDKAIQANGDLQKAGKMDPQQADEEIKRLEFAYSSIMGRPLNSVENTGFGHTARLVRKFNFARIMNQVGFAQVSEIGMSMAHLGVKASFTQMPALRRIKGMDGASILKSKLADDLEVWQGFGGDRLTASAEYRFDDLTGIHDAPTGSFLDKVEHGLNVAGRITSETSGLMQANVMLYRHTAASIVQRFADMAHGGGMMTAKRLADLGLDEDMTKRILVAFKDPNSFEYTTGFLTNKKVSRAHFDKWADKEAAEAFRRASYRLATTIIQKNDVGNLMMWMSHPAAKLLMQFRTFMVGAYEKQTLKSAHMRDGTALKALAATAGFAALSYIVQTKIAAATRSDGDKYLEERLSWEKIGTAAFARAGMSSIIPMVIDTGAYFTGQDAVFSHTRTTGQVSNMILGNPTSGGVDDFAQAFRAIAGLAEDRAWSQEEARALTRVIPFGNSIWMTGGLNSMIGDLPDFAPRDR